MLQEYQTLKRMEDIDLRQYLQTQNMHMINEGVKVRQEKERKELVDDLERLKLLKLSSDEEQRRKMLERLELVDTQNKFLEYREKLKENERVEERQKHVDY